MICLMLIDPKSCPLTPDFRVRWRPLPPTVKETAVRLYKGREGVSFRRYLLLPLIAVMAFIHSWATWRSCASFKRICSWSAANCSSLIQPSGSGGGDSDNERGLRGVEGGSITSLPDSFSKFLWLKSICEHGRRDVKDLPCPTSAFDLIHKQQNSNEHHEDVNEERVSSRVR